jgi:hypothetical protein
MRAWSKRTSAVTILAAVCVLGLAWICFQVGTTGHTGILRALVGVKHFLRNASIPAAAQSPRASALTGPQHSVTLSWQASKTEGVGYNVYRRDASGTVKLNSAPVAQTTYVDKTVQPGQTYYYMTKAVSAKGESIPSNEVRVNIGSP